jgi:RNA polymerase subunit RPABC4/transcription elongation factor Spt4
MVVLFWLAFSIVVGIAAENRGRNGFGWLLLSALISPLLGLILVLILPSKVPGNEAPSPKTHVRCPECRELVFKDARLCKHCGTRLIPAESSNSHPLEKKSVFVDAGIPREKIQEILTEKAAKNNRWVCLKCLNEFYSEINTCRSCNSAEFVSAK